MQPRKVRPPDAPHSNHHLQDSEGLNSKHCHGDHFQHKNNKEDIPEAPPLPSIEYLLGKRSINLRKRTIKTLKEQIKEKVATMSNVDDPCDSDSHSSFGSSRGDQHRYRRRKHKKKKKTTTGKEEHEERLLESSPPRVIKASPGLERFPTPYPSAPNSSRFVEKMPIQQKIDFDSAFDEVTNELEALASSPPSFSPVVLLPTSFISSVDNPSLGKILGGKVHPVPQATFAHKNLGTTVSPVTQKISKRGGPKLLPHQKNVQDVRKFMSGSVPERHKNVVDGRLIYSSIKKQKKQDNLPQSIAISSNQPSHSCVSHPMVHNQSLNQDSPPMDIDEIELQLNEMKLMLENAVGAAITANNTKHPSSPDLQESYDETSDSESGSTEYTSSSDADTDSSCSEDSSSEDSNNDSGGEKQILSGPKRAAIVRNIGMGGSNRASGMKFNRARMLSRYPRLLGRRVIFLDTVEEAIEEVIYLAKTDLERADIFHRLRVEKQCMKKWLKYIQILRNAHRKADKIIQRRRREFLARAFYAWIQVRNVSAVEKIDIKKASMHYRRKILKRVLYAWHLSNDTSPHEVNMALADPRSTSQHLINAEEKYLDWLNKQLLACNCNEATDIEDSLADGVLIIKALSHASNTKPPKFNTRPKLPLHRQDNWKMAHEFMKTLGINVRGIEPADLANIVPAAIHNMFNQVLKWHEHHTSTDQFR